MSKTILFFPKLEPAKDYHYMPISLLAVASSMPNKDLIILDERVLNNIYAHIFHQIHNNISEIMFTVYTGYQLTRAYKISQWIKKLWPSVKIIWGGPHVTALPEQTLASKYVDEIYCGYAEKGENELPWHLINIENYINPKTERFIYISSYGCVGQCTFCATKERRGLVFIPLEKVEKDIDNLMKLYLFKECVIFDATTFTKPERALFIANLMKKHNLKWIADSRADEICRIPKNMLDEIIDSGLTQLTIGLESGSPKVVEMMKKGKNHLENYKKCAEIMSKYDVKMCSGVIFGCPGEGPENIKQTIEYIKEIRKINPNFYISSTFFMPLPNTEMCDIAKEYGYREPQSLQEWAEYGENSHYSYNQYHSSMWIKEPEEYKRIYDEFIKENKELFI